MAFSSTLGIVVAALFAQAGAVPVARLNKDSLDGQEVRPRPRPRPLASRSTHTSETRALTGRIACRSMLSRDARGGSRPTSARTNWRVRVHVTGFQMSRARNTFTRSTASGTVAAKALFPVTAARGRAARSRSLNTRKGVYRAIWGCVPLHTCAPQHLLTAHERRAPCAYVRRECGGGCPVRR